ncbi:MAG TPA: hypothetical protein VD837_19820 [Terriglobales bacterium]|nr:hypothetical protein [Terriglobales bacterium]
MKTWKRVSLVAVTIGIAFGFAFYRNLQNCKKLESYGTTVKQGCINQGNDCRMFATVICWSQRQMSWKSEREPHFVLLGEPDRTHLGLAWPPYLVFNSPDRNGRWRMFRVGFRYDRTWKGYIFPTVAAKYVEQPLRY